MKGVLGGNIIDEYMSDMPLRANELFVQDLMALDSTLHNKNNANAWSAWQNSRSLNMEIDWQRMVVVLIHRVFQPPQLCQSLGRWYTNCHHDPIMFEKMCSTKWWQNQQFTFTLSVVEENEIKLGLVPGGKQQNQCSIFASNLQNTCFPTNLVIMV